MSFPSINMAQQVSLATLYGDLNRSNQNQEFERALKIVNKILHEAPNESTAFHCKVVCLMKLDKYSEALAVIQKAKAFSSPWKFEKAYCEYRLNRIQDARSTLHSIENPDNRAKELLAQVLYRLERYDECYDMYRDLIKNSNDEFDEERETNLSAVLASLTLWNKKEVEDPSLRDNSYELCYNHACYLLGKDDLKAAETKLRTAEILGKKTYEDDPDMTEEDIQEELAVTRVQLAYVLQKQGRVEEATQIYNQVLKHKPSDVGVTAVASNNMVCLNKDQNVFDSKKKMKAATSDNLKHKMTSKQRRCINVNQCLFHLYANQSDQCHLLASRLLEQYPDMDVPIMIEAAQFVKDKNSTKATEKLQGFAVKHPEQSVGIQLVIAQLQLTQGCVYPACSALCSLGDFQYRPGVVSALVTLYRSQEDMSAASEVLSKAITWYRSNQQNSPDLAILIRANSNFQSKYGSVRTAAEMLEELHRLNPEDPHILAKLISAYSQFDPAKAQAIGKDLPSVDKLAQNVDVDALEASFSTVGSKYMKKTPKAEPSPGPSGDMLIKKKKKKKKTKLPKNYEPGVIPDPERWIPKKERSYYRGKRKDRKKDISKGTQGTTGPAGDMDASRPTDAGSPRTGSGPAKDSPQAATGRTQLVGPRQQKPVQANKKKKKKGGNKW